MQPDPITFLELITLLIAAFGAITGLAALTWNVIQFYLSGHRVLVEATHGVTIPPASWNISVRVVNRGRSAVAVKNIDIVPTAPNGTPISWTQWNGGPIPFRLEGNDSETWRVDEPTTLQRMLDNDRQDALECRAVVRLGNGKPVSSKKIRIHPDEITGLSIRVVRIEGEIPGTQEPDELDNP